MRCAAKGELVAYVGYDCTAPSLHVGNLISIMMLYWLQQAGGKPIALMGGGTTSVGILRGATSRGRSSPSNKSMEQGVDQVGVFPLSEFRRRSA